MKVERVLGEVLEKLELKNFRTSIEKASERLSAAPYLIYDIFPYLTKYEDEVRRSKEEVLSNIDYYIDVTLKNVRKNAGEGYYVKSREDVYNILVDIVGEDKKIIVKSKSMVTEELSIREFLESHGHEVYETDLGQFLIQLSGDKPMHTVAPAVHIDRIGAIRLLQGLGIDIDSRATIEEIVKKVRAYLRSKFIEADIGISGANVISADTGTVFLISNEGNIRNTTNLPPVHITITGIEKIMPNMEMAFKQAILQAANAGLYPPTYLSLVSGPSSTADIEFKRVYGVHGPIKSHLILYDGGRTSALKDNVLYEQLLCIRCGRCVDACPMGLIPTELARYARFKKYELAERALDCIECGCCSFICPAKINLVQYIKLAKVEIHRNRIFQ